MEKKTTDDQVKGLSEENDSGSFLPKKRSRKKIIAIVAILGVVILGYFLSAGQGAAGKYEFIKVERKDLREVVEITGNVEAGASILLNFRENGQIETIPFEVGEELKKDEVIASLKNRDQQLKLNQAQANLAGAIANLNEKVAGEAPEEIKIAIAGVKQAEAAAEKTWIDYENALKEKELIRKKYEQDEKKAQLIVDDAKADYEFSVKNQTNTGKTKELAVETAKKDLEAQLYSTLNQIQSSLVNLESIIIDDGNSIIDDDIWRLNSQSVNKTTTKYLEANSLFKKISQELQAGKNYEPAQLETFSIQQQKIATNLLEAQSIILDELAVLFPSNTLTTTELEEIKTKIVNNNTSLSSSYASLNLKYQAILDAQLGKFTSSDSKESEVGSAKSLYEQQIQTYQQTLIDHEVDINKREANIRSLKAQHDIQLAEIDSAQASLEVKTAPPRPVEIAFLQAQVSVNEIAVALAQEGFEKTLLKAPINGILSRKNIDVGEDVTAGGGTQSSFEMISDQKFKINAEIAEVDIGKIKIGTKVKIKLDAVGSDEIFNGEIVRIDPVETVIQDVVFYRAEIVIDSEDERIKPGMTANVEIVINERTQVLTVPEKAILSEGDKKIVRQLVNGKIRNITVETGIRDIQGSIEVMSGLEEGQEIILRTLNGRS